MFEQGLDIKMRRPKVRIMGCLLAAGVFGVTGCSRPVDSIDDSSVNIEHITDPEANIPAGSNLHTTPHRSSFDDQYGLCATTTSPISLYNREIATKEGYRDDANGIWIGLDPSLVVGHVDVSRCHQLYQQKLWIAQEDDATNPGIYVAGQQ